MVLTIASPVASLKSHRSFASAGAVRSRPAAILHGGGIAASPDSASFVAMLAAFSGTGGTARAEELARLMAQHHRGDYISLARLMANGDVFSFVWRGESWIPMFQFDEGDLSVNPSAREVRAHLTQCGDGWALAAWFVSPHPALDMRRPIDLLASEQQRVVSAARLHSGLAL